MNYRLRPVRSVSGAAVIFFSNGCSLYISSFCLCALNLCAFAPTLPKHRLHLSSPPSPSLLPSCHWCLRQYLLNTPSSPSLYSNPSLPPTPCAPPPPLLRWLSLGVPLSSVADREHGWLTRQVMSLLMQMASTAPFSSLTLAHLLFFTSLSFTHKHAQMCKGTYTFWQHLNSSSSSSSSPFSSRSSKVVLG